MSRFTTVLVANRGEIACRVLRAARGLGYGTVAVYSEADAGAPHVRLADRAVCIGGSKASDSYLRIENILDAARRAGAQAIHPGYGFLSENAQFAEAVVAAGMVFIGPPAEAIRLMGDKARAKARMQEAGVPTVPGFLGADIDEAAAAKVGYPLLVKATAGGGGRGIRIVREAKELQEALASARAEAASAFGSADVMLERFVERGRHVEVQVFADEHGNVISLGERDCTAQRRRQKVIEEAPSPIVSPALRQTLGEAAVAAARAVGYRGAGTVEFIVDQQGAPYFLEMNTRLQVEHPVTELVTGLDLVELQLRVAAGDPLGVGEVETRGHAIEVRLYAEDPYTGFTPQVGVIARFDQERALQFPGIRIDSGVATGSQVTPFYDAMIAKIIAYGRTRGEATRRLQRAIAEAALFGLRTNARFLSDLLGSEEFQAATMYTSLLDEKPVLQAPQPSPALWALAFALRGGATHVLRADSVANLSITLACEGQERTARVERGDGFRVDGAELRLLSVTDTDVRFELDGVQSTRRLWRDANTVQLAEAGSVFVFQEPSALRAASSNADPSRVVAPLAGTLARVIAAVGTVVEAGALLLVVEAMKMEVKVFAGCAGTIKQQHRNAGDQVSANELLMEIER